MGFTPHRLQVGTNFDDSIPLINDNFDQAVSDMRDLGASTSTSIIVPFTITTDALAAQTVVLIGSHQTSGSPYIIYTTKPVAQVADAQEFSDIYVDTQDAAHLWPYGGSLTAEQLNFQVTITKSNTVYSGSLAAFTIQILNRGASTHTYFVNLGCWYIPMRAQGIFQ